VPEGVKAIAGGDCVGQSHRKMKSAGKLLLYLVFLMLAVFCFGRFQRDYSRSDVGVRQFEQPEPGDPPKESLNPEDAGATNGVAGAATNGVAGEDGATNTVGSATNAVASAPGGGAGTGGAGKATVGKPANKSAVYLGGFVAALLGFAGLLGWDVTQWVARKSAQGLGVDVRPVENDPEYDAAEAEWAKGNHMDAIKMLREFLKKNPAQQHAAIRIAEIYEKDLGNYLAAALELEEVLGKRLPREKWGWTAIHLANIYSGRLNQADKALGVLDRIVKDYPDTSAAKKARQRLGLPEPVEPSAGDLAAADGESETSPAPEAPGEDPENPAMPKGFKPRKR
jgi:TolA-binding protein